MKEKRLTKHEIYLRMMKASDPRFDMDGDFGRKPTRREKKIIKKVLENKNYD